MLLSLLPIEENDETSVRTDHLISMFPYMHTN